MCSPGGTNYHVCTFQELFVKEEVFPVNFVTRPKMTRDVGDFLKHSAKGDHSI